MADSKSIHVEPQPLSPVETAGGILSSARKGWDLSIEEVAENLNLGPDTIKALESNEYDNLPGSTFVKGYLRSYAVLLKLNPDEVIATIDLEPEKLSKIPISKRAIKFKGYTKSRRKKKGRSFFKGLLFLVIFVGLVLFGLNQWSRLDTSGLAELFKLPAGESATNAGDGSEILFPSGENTVEQSDKPKQALIRIE